MIISVGYRIRSIIATRFRQWATERLHEYIVKGFALDDERLKNLGGGSYCSRSAKLKQVWFCSLLIGLFVVVRIIDALHENFAVVNAVCHRT